MKKRLVVLLLVLIMSVLILPVTAYAESYGVEEIYVSFERAEAENISYAFPKNQERRRIRRRNARYNDRVKDAF